jgi:DNA-binding MarR family transcriptional regulator
MNLSENEIIEFHNTLIDLIKKYQFRDRNQVTCYGISLSQCYILEMLHYHGALTMKELAKKMHLDISTVSRTVQNLILKKLVTKNIGMDDRRIRRMILTLKGKELFLKSWKEVIESEKRIIENIKPENRRELIDLLKELNKSVDLWQKSCNIN